MPFSRNKSLRFIVPIAVIVLILNALIPIVAFKFLSISYAKTNYSRDIIDKATNVMLSMVNAETGMRGYILTNNPKFLDPYYEARTQLDNQRYELKTLAASTPATAQVLETLAARIDFSREHIHKVISTNEETNNRLAVDLIRSGEGKA